jgi:redox-sensitive bicupin YhaK (pirin superfamily)
MLSRRRDLLRAAAGLGTASLFGCDAAAERPLREVAASKPTDRSVVRVVAGTRSRDGAGVALRRMLGSAALPMIDPFLMLDVIETDRPEDYVRGFPRHPHRGFETVTYLIEGSMQHEDSRGNRGRLTSGSAQWMTAGRGIVHAEMPGQREGLLWGLQLWVNLPASRKMMAPRYQDIAPETIPELDLGTARARVVAGSVDAGGGSSRRGPVDGIVIEPTMLDVTLPSNGSFRHERPSNHASFVLVLAGSASLGADATAVSAGEIAALGSGSAVSAASASGARLLVLAGAPIGEPVARRGPFVMNTEAELDQAWADYRSGRLEG